MFAHSLTARLTTKLALFLSNCREGSKTAAALDRLAASLSAVFAASTLAKVLWHRDVSPPIWHKSLLHRLYRAPQWLLIKILLPISRLAGKSLPASITYRAYKYTVARPYLLFIIFGILALTALALLPFSLALKLLAAAAVLFPVLHNTGWGLFLLAFALPFVTNEMLLLLAGLIGVSFAVHSVLKGRLKLLPLPVEPALVIYLLTAVLATLGSATLKGSLRDLAMYAFSFLAFFVLINQIKTKKELKTFLMIALLSGLLVALFGIYQYLTGAPMEEGWIDPVRGSEITVRVYSFFGNPNVLAEYLLMLIPFAAALFFTAKKPQAKLFYLVTACILALCLLLTFSRGGLLGLLVAAVFFILLKDRKLIILLLIAALIGAAAMPDVFLQRFSSIGDPQDTSTAYRLTVWKETLGMVKDYPLTGVGLGYQAFQKMYPYYMLDRTKRPFHSHNAYLQITAEMGIIGLLAFLWLLAGIFKRGMKALGTSRDKFLSHTVMAALSALLGILTQGIAEVIIYMPKITMLFWLTAALVFLCIKLESQNNALGSED